MTYLDGALQEVGEKASLKKVSSESVNKYGDADTTYETVTVEGVFQLMNAADDEVREGDFESGDLNAYFDPDVNGIEHGAIIEYNGTSYEIDDVQRKNVPGEGAHIEVRARKV